MLAHLKMQLIQSAQSSLRRLSGHLVCKTAAEILQQVLGSIPFFFPNLAWGSFSVLGCQFLREEPQLHNKQTKKQACSEIFAAGAHLLRCSFIWTSPGFFYSSCKRISGRASASQTTGRPSNKKILRHLLLCFTPTPPPKPPYSL